MTAPAPGRSLPLAAPTAARRWSAIAAFLLALALVLPGASPARAQVIEPDLEAQMLALINGARTDNGLAPLTLELQMTRIARDWSDTMAANGGISHRPNLRDHIDGDWRRIGENVGVGPGIPRLHEAFMDSPGHRANVLGDYDRVGIGVVVANGRVWITINFLLGRGDFPVFADVRSGGHRVNIETLFARATTTGCTGARYCPTSPVTRAQMATFLVRELGLPAGNRTFTDVPASSAHAAAIGALAAAGITEGCAANRYCPNDPVNRGQMATFLRRALDLPERAPTGMTDIPAGYAHAGSIGALQHAGITEGCGTGRFCPGAHVSRAQMASFLARSFD